MDNTDPANSNINEHDATIQQICKIMHDTILGVEMGWYCTVAGLPEVLTFDNPLADILQTSPRNMSHSAWFNRCKK